MSGLVTAIRITCVLTLILFATPARADKDKLRDFTEAVAREGQQSYVHPWCDGGHGPVSCQMNVTATLRVKLVSDQAQLSRDQDERRNLDDKRARATDDAERARLTNEIESIDKEIEATRRRIDDSTRELSNRKYVVENTLATISKCIDYRRAVMNVFAYATDKVRGENDPDLKPLVEMLRGKYAEKIDGHNVALGDKANALRNCKDELP